MFQGVPMRFKVFQGVVRYSEAFQGVQGWFMVFQGGSWCSKVFLVLARHYKYSLAFPGAPMYSGVPRHSKDISGAFLDVPQPWNTSEHN